MTDTQNQSDQNQLYYLQDSRTYHGNDIVWWAKDCNGYTSKLINAHNFTKEEAFAQNRMRSTDIPWPKTYIDAKTHIAVDTQYCKLKEALGKDHTNLYKPKPPKRTPVHCCYCASFMSDQQVYIGCPKCAGDNRP